MSFLALSGRESSLVQTFCESCEQLNVTHPSTRMTRRFVIQGCPTLKDGLWWSWFYDSIFISGTMSVLLYNEALGTSSLLAVEGEAV